MRYELYKAIKMVDEPPPNEGDNYQYFFELQSDTVDAVIAYVENHECSLPHECYVMIDHETPYLLPYRQLGFAYMPSDREWYDRIYMCKCSKHLNSYDFEEDYKEHYRRGYELAIKETYAYFDRIQRWHEARSFIL